MVAAEDRRATVHDLTAVPVYLTPQVIYQQVAVDPGSKRDQRRDHLHTGAHGVDQVSPRIKPDIGLEDIVGHHSEPVVVDVRPDIGAESKGTGGRDHPGSIGVISDAHLHGPQVAGGYILPDTSFNTFIVPHYPEDM